MVRSFKITFAITAYASAFNPLRSMILSSFSAGPLGFLSPISHLCTVDTLVLRQAANTHNAGEHCLTESSRPIGVAWYGEQDENRSFVIVRY